MVRTLLHLADKLLVEKTAGLLVERAVDGDYVTLGKHVLELVNSPAANLLLNFGTERLVIEVEQLLAVERLQSAKDTLANTTDGDGTDGLALEIVLILGDSGNVPVTGRNLLVGWDKVADEDEHGHDDVLSDRDDIGASDLGYGDATVGGVGGVQVDVIRTDTSGDGDLELLGLCETLCGKVTWVEAGCLG